MRIGAMENGDIVTLKPSRNLVVDLLTLKTKSWSSN